MPGIKARVVGSYLIIILVTVFILEGLLILAIRNYYYQNVETTLINQAEMSAHFFERYVADDSWEQKSAELLESFANHTSAQVQIISSSGRLLQDSKGLVAKPFNLKFPDTEEALQGKVGIWKGKHPLTNEPILAVSYPLLYSGELVGLVRYLTSLTTLEKVLMTISLLFLLIGLLVITIATVVSLLLAKSITDPVINLTASAKKMAEGDFSLRAIKHYDDELGKLAETLNVMAQKIVQTDQLKSEFISSISHELRTPLTAIKGWAVTLRLDQEDGRVKFVEGLHVIEQECDRLTQLVEELLDFSSLDAGKITLQLTETNIPRLLHYIVTQLTPRAIRQGINLEINVDDGLLTIRADENRLKQVLINILDNSLKFTASPGSITVEASATTKHIVITVEDTGSGISDLDIEHVFQKFYKGSSQATGSGLGLAIAKQIIQLHHGQLNIESTEGIGTKVEIILPL